MSDATLSPAPRRRRRGRTLLLATIVFVSGAIVGAGGAVVVISRGIQRSIQQPEQMPDRVADRLARRLDLDDAQRSQVRAILARRQATLARIRADVQPRVTNELAGIRAEVGDVLDARQRARWDALYTELFNRWLPPLPATVPTTGPTTGPADAF